MSVTAIRTSLAEALDAAEAMAPSTPAEAVPLAACAGRRLAAPVLARHDLPAADAAAMDGWAIAAAEAPGTLRVVGEAGAGRPFTGTVGAGEACRISTGALLPEGTDAVLRLEDGTVRDGVLRCPSVARGRDVRPRASEVAAGEQVLPAGRILAAHDVGVIAALDHTHARCHRPVRVALLGSGDELVDPGAAMSPASVVDSNIPMLRAMVAAAGGLVVHAARVPDAADALGDGIAAALAAGAEMLVTVGGASVGRHDHIRPALARMGAEPAADGLRVRPGHPVWLGTLRGVPVLALPGNPGAALVMFHLLGRRLLGHPPGWVTTPVLADIPARADDDRVFRCAMAQGGLVPLEDQRPASVRAMGWCDALAWIPAGADLRAGDPVQASMLP